MLWFVPSINKITHPWLCCGHARPKMVCSLLQLRLGEQLLGAVRMPVMRCRPQRLAQGIELQLLLVLQEPRLQSRGRPPCWSTGCRQAPAACFWRDKSPPHSQARCCMYTGSGYRLMDDASTRTDFNLLQSYSARKCTKQRLVEASTEGEGGSQETTRLYSERQKPVQSPQNAIPDRHLIVAFLMRLAMDQRKPGSLRTEQGQDLTMQRLMKFCGTFSSTVARPHSR